MENGSKKIKIKPWWTKPGKYCLSQVIKVNTNSGKSCWEYVPWVWFDETSLYLCDQYPQNCQSLKTRQVCETPMAQSFPSIKNRWTLTWDTGLGPGTIKEKTKQIQKVCLRLIMMTQYWLTNYDKCFLLTLTMRGTPSRPMLNCSRKPGSGPAASNADLQIHEQE